MINLREFKELAITKVMLALTFFSSFIIVLIVLGLIYKAYPILSTKSFLDLIFSNVWSPFKGLFGFWPFIVGTFYVTIVAMIIAVPLGIFSSIYISEYASNKLRNFLKPMIDLLAGIPSVVYGLWGVLVIVPIVRAVGQAFGSDTTGYSVLAGGIVLAIMVFPVIISISEEVMKSVPQGLREASTALGATKWQTTKHVVVRTAAPGILAGVMLGFSRAFGETMAVLMVVGNVAQIPSSIFQSAYPLPALIANNYGEMMSIPLYDSALMLAALILLGIVLIFNILAQVVLIKIKARIC